jgi:hypothetical protein
MSPVFSVTSRVWSLTKDIPHGSLSSLVTLKILNFSFEETPVLKYMKNKKTKIILIMNIII